MITSENRPPLVQEAIARAAALRFELSCEDFVGRLLALLAANVRPEGRILELGTGAGVGLSWIVSGLSHRSDVAVITVDTDEALLAEVRRSEWPDSVQFIHGDGAQQVAKQGRFDLIFADAPGGKIENIEGTISALHINGLLVVDDMDLAKYADDHSLRDSIKDLTELLRADPRLLCVECPISSKVILTVRCG